MTKFAKQEHTFTDTHPSLRKHWQVLRSILDLQFPGTGLGRTVSQKLLGVLKSKTEKLVEW